MNREALECIKSVKYSYYLIENNIKKEGIFSDFEKQEIGKKEIQKRETNDMKKKCEFY